jgi:transketolase
MGSPLGWEKYVGEKGAVLGINTFGASGNGNKLIEEYGFTVENVVNKVEELLK